MNKIQPIKKLGQNFLVDKNIIKKIINQINPLNEDIFLEIGPGQGALTEHLVSKAKKVYAVEIDTRVIEILQKNFPMLNLINQDILKFQFDSLKEKNIRVAGNIPYNITSPILFALIKNRNYITDCHLMMQLEVAKRLIAKKNSRDYGILSVILDYFGTTDFCFKISPNVFYPRPKVYSAIVRINFTKKNIDEEFNKLFIQVVKAAFQNRRKTLKNSLSNSIFKDCSFEKSELDLSKRAEQLSTSDFIELTKHIKQEYL